MEGALQVPRPHQAVAISSCVSGLGPPHSRGQCIMACGTGKTLVGYEVAHGLKVKCLLTLVPSLLLVNQMIREYRARGAKHILAVCSDETSGDEDSIQISVKELEADNTTDAKVARAFLDGPGQRIVVCTYQSLRSLSEVFEGLAFDLAIFDEAHKTAGRKSKLFAHGLTDDSVKCARRLFMTATPRHATLKEDGSEAQVYAMNNPQVYGPVLYSLPLRNAIEAGIIDDYRIIVAIVSQRGTEDLKEQAIRVAIDRAMKVYGIRKVFTFHARVADASNFILGATDTLKGARLYHVNGMQSSAERGIKLEGFRNADAALMSNARCLTEGVDLPAADMVAFLSPKKNPIDIVQAVGRVLRKHHSKAKGGYVFLPVFVRAGADEEAAIAESDWSSCYEVLQALREQDEPLSVALSKCARGDGELPEKIEIMDGRKRGGEELEPDRAQFSEGMRRAIRVRLVRPFVPSAATKKLELLELARSGADRPISTTPLGRAFSSYMPNASAHDQLFIASIKAINPAWVDRSWKFKKRILDMVKEGEDRPGAQSSVGAAFKRLTTKGHTQYDAEFCEHLRSIAPSWFYCRNVDSNEVKARLITIAKSGAGKPPAGSSERSCLLRYTDSRDPRYDVGFHTQIVSIAPEWFVDKTQQSRDTLLAMAKRGLPMPERYSGLRSFLWRANNPKSERQYDPGFIDELRRLNPSWDLRTDGKRRLFKEAILSCASKCDGKPKSSVLPPYLYGPAGRYTQDGGPAFDPEFTDKLRRLAPHWFKNKRHVAHAV